MGFRDIKGQERVVEFFRSSINQDRLAHAYIFCGPPGLGKTLLAGELAKFLNCQNPEKQGRVLVDCCNLCVSCRKIDDFNHPDVHWIEASKEAKNISIDEVRLMQKEIALKNYEGKCKVFIMLNAQEMTQQAADCLLKTLEEPPALTLIILITADSYALSSTIVSRCQVIKFSPLEYARLNRILREDYSISPAHAHFLSVASEGRLGWALNLQEKGTLNNKNRLIDKIFQKRKLPAAEIFNIKEKKELKTEISYLLNWFRDMFIFKAGLPQDNMINADRCREIRSRSSFFSQQELEQVISKIDQAHRLIAQNVNPKIALEIMLLEVEKCKR